MAWFNFSQGVYGHRLYSTKPSYVETLITS
jgi:hypothetical protein